ncbi:MAG: sigma-70 domain-containing protein [Clostridium sp.]
MEVNFYEMYLEEMALIPVLEAEEEEKVLALAATGDKEAKKRLVEGSLAKVAQMVKEYEGRELPVSVVQEANVATAAAAAYDGSQQWQEFLAQEIRQAVEAALEEQKTEAEIEENMTARVNVLQTVSQVMAKELGREATVAELAEKMKMTEDEVKDIMKLALDAITVNGEGAVSEEQQKEEE